MPVSDRRTVLVIIAMFLYWTNLTFAQITLLDSFSVGESEILGLKIGFNPVSENLFVHLFDDTSRGLTEYSQGGTVVRSFGPTLDFGTGGFDFTPSPIVIDGNEIPAGHLINLDTAFHSLRSFDLTAGTSTPGINLVNGNQGYSGIGLDVANGIAVVGESFFHNLTLVNFETNSLDNRNLSSNQFVVLDLDVLAATNTAFVVGFETQINELSYDGEVLDSIDLAPLGVTGHLASLTFNDEAGEAWVANDSGTIYRLGGFPAVPEPASVILTFSGLILLFVTRRNTRPTC